MFDVDPDPARSFGIRAVIEVKSVGVEGGHVDAEPLTPAADISAFAPGRS